MEHVHGHAERGTEVPRSKLVRALRARSAFFTTQELRAAPYHDVELPVGE